LFISATKTSSKDSVGMSDREVEHSELWHSVFASGCIQTDGPDVENKVSCSRCV